MPLQLDLLDSVRDPHDPPWSLAQFADAPDGGKIYLVYVYLGGPHVSSVHRARYIFPKDFTQPVVWADMSDGPLAKTTILTRTSAFEISVNVWMDDGRFDRIAHKMQFHFEIQKMKRTQFVQNQGLLLQPYLNQPR